MTVAVESGLETLILEHAEAAAERAEASWQSLAPGRSCSPMPARTSAGPRATSVAQAERAVRDWQSDVLEMVRTEGADKRGTARFLAYGVNGLGVALMIVVFAHTGGVLLGAEAGIAGGSAVLGQKLLEAVFGDQAVRTLAERARRVLEARSPSCSAASARVTSICSSASRSRPKRPRSCGRLAAGRRHSLPAVARATGTRTPLGFRRAPAD